MWSPSPAHSAALSLVSAWLLVTPALRAAEGDLLYSRVLAFDVGDTLGDTPAAIAAAPDGKIVQFGTVVTGAARHLENGFGALPAERNARHRLRHGREGGRPLFCSHRTRGAWRFTLLPNGQILVAGTVDFGGGNHNLLVGGLDPNGVPNELFGVSGEGYAFETISTGGDNTDDLGAMTVDRFGRIVVVGTVDAGPTDTEIGVARFTAGGVSGRLLARATENTMIAIAAAGGKDLGLAIAIDNQDRIIVGGAAWSTSSGTDFDWALAVLDSAGDASTPRSTPTASGPIRRTAAERTTTSSGISRSGPTARSWPAETGRSAPPGGRRPSSLHRAGRRRTHHPKLQLLWHSRFALHQRTAGFRSVASPPRQRQDRHRRLRPGPAARRLRCRAPASESLPRRFFRRRRDDDLRFQLGLRRRRRDTGSAAAFDRDGRIVVGGPVEWSGVDTDFGWVQLDSVVHLRRRLRLARRLGALVPSRELNSRRTDSSLNCRRGARRGARFPMKRCHSLKALGSRGEVFLCERGSSPGPALRTRGVACASCGSSSVMVSSRLSRAVRTSHSSGSRHGRGLSFSEPLTAFGCPRRSSVPGRVQGMKRQSPG